MKAKKISLLLATLLMVGCVTKIAPHELNKLPRSRGPGPSDSIPSSPWLYKGSDENGHHFNYYWHYPEALRMKVIDVRVENSVEIESPLPVTADRIHWLEMAPETDTNGRLISFRAVPRMHPGPTSLVGGLNLDRED